jgi:hypothetical protein
MKSFNKTIIALTLSLLGAVSSVSALAITSDNNSRQEVEITVDGDKNNMSVFVSVDGEITNADVSASAMSNPEELRKLLVDVPQDIREKLIGRLTSAMGDNGNFRMVVDADINQELHVISESDHDIEVIGDNGENKVFVMKFDGDKSQIDLSQKVIEKMMKPSHHKNVQVIHQGNMSAKSLLRMIKHSDFTADELNEIQQALDTKR